MLTMHINDYNKLYIETYFDEMKSSKKLKWLANQSWLYLQIEGSTCNDVMSEGVLEVKRICYRAQDLWSPCILSLTLPPASSDQAVKRCEAACQGSGILSDRTAQNECKHPAGNSLIGLRASIHQQLHTPFTSLWKNYLFSLLFGLKRSAKFNTR